MRWAGLLVVLRLAVGLQAEVTNDWSGTLAAARGQTVYWNAWGGDPLINGYVEWATREVRQRFGVDARWSANIWARPPGSVT